MPPPPVPPATATDEAVSPGVVVFNRSIAACPHEHRWKDVLRLLRGMPSRGATPDIVSYNNTAIDAFRREGDGEGQQWGEVVNTLVEMRALGVITLTPARTLPRCSRVKDTAAAAAAVTAVTVTPASWMSGVARALPYHGGEAPQTYISMVPYRYRIVQNMRLLCKCTHGRNTYIYIPPVDRYIYIYSS